MTYITTCCKSLLLLQNFAQLTDPSHELLQPPDAHSGTVRIEHVAMTTNACEFPFHDWITPLRTPDNEIRDALYITFGCSETLSMSPFDKDGVDLDSLWGYR